MTSWTCILSGAANPLVRTEDGEIIALDGKVSLDENAAFTGGNQLSCSISPDGRWVTFASSNRLVSTATSSLHTYLRDMD